MVRIQVAAQGKHRLGATQISTRTGVFIDSCRSIQPMRRWIM